MRAGKKLCFPCCPGCGQYMKSDDWDSFSWALEASVFNFLFLGAADITNMAPCWLAFGWQASRAEATQGWVSQPGPCCSRQALAVCLTFWLPHPRGTSHAWLSWSPYMQPYSVAQPLTTRPVLTTAQFFSITDYDRSGCKQYCHLCEKGMLVVEKEVCVCVYWSI